MMLSTLPYGKAWRELLVEGEEPMLENETTQDDRIELSWVAATTAPRGDGTSFTEEALEALAADYRTKGTIAYRGPTGELFDCAIVEASVRASVVRGEERVLMLTAKVPTDALCAACHHGPPTIVPPHPEESCVGTARIAEEVGLRAAREWLTKSFGDEARLYDARFEPKKVRIIDEVSDVAVSICPGGDDVRQVHDATTGEPLDAHFEMRGQARYHEEPIEKHPAYLLELPGRNPIVASDLAGLWGTLSAELARELAATKRKAELEVLRRENLEARLRALESGESRLLRLRLVEPREREIELRDARTFEIPVASADVTFLIPELPPREDGKRRDWLEDRRLRQDLERSLFSPETVSALRKVFEGHPLVMLSPLPAGCKLSVYELELPARAEPALDGVVHA